MRPTVCNLWQNTGSAAPGNQAVLTSRLVKVGSLASTVDDQLTKITPGEMTAEIQDPDDSIWAFIQGQLAISGGLLPPWLQLTVGGNQVFLGTVDPSRIVRHLAAGVHSIELGAQDWSVMLSNQYLDTWSRPVPLVAGNRPATAALEGYSTLAVNMEYGMWLCDAVFPGPPNWVRAGDRMTNDAPGMSGVVFTVITAVSPDNSNFRAGLSGNEQYPVEDSWTQVTFDKSPWWTSDAAMRAAYQNHTYDPAGYRTANFIRMSSDSNEQDYYTVLTAVGGNPSPEVHSIDLDGVDGITAGDVMHCILGTRAASWTVLSVDPELRRITVKEAVTNLDAGNRIYFDAATNAELVLQDARKIMRMAAAPFSVDLSRFIHAPLLIPVFAWLPLQSSVGTNDLMIVSDVEPNAAGVRVISGLTNAYHGNPDTGWTAETAVTLPATQAQGADWTGQIAAPPASLMPYETRTASPGARLRNRVYNEFNWQTVNNGPVPSAGLPSTWVNPFLAQNTGHIPLHLFHDYLPGTPRKITIAAGGVGLTATPWTGSWGTPVGLTWPTANAITSLCNFPTGPAGALLAITSANTLELALLPGLVSCAVPQWLQGGILVPTLGGPYLIAAQGYARVTYSAGVLALVGVPFTDGITCFWPNTFVARTSTEAVVMGRLDVPDDSGSGASTTESWLFRLALPPNLSAPSASIVFSEKIAEGSPVFAGAMLDPSRAGRVVGHYGGRLFQVDTVAPWTVERFTPAGMAALECLEHVCQLNNAMAVPMPSGTMAVVSRGIVETPIALTVSMVKNDQSLSWANFYSIVRCTTQDGTYYYDAQGQDGGNLLEINNQPMLWSLSQAGAMAESYASWFGSPRPTESHSWTWADANSAPPWEGLPAFARVTVNGTGPWRVMSTDQDYIEGTCQAVLVKDA